MKASKMHISFVVALVVLPACLLQQVTGSDVTTVERLEEQLRAFSIVRSHAQPEDKDKVRDYIRTFLTNIGREGAIIDDQGFTRNFTADNATAPGKNFIYILPGARWGTTEDRPILLGTHYDSVYNSSGVDDNGSSMAAMLEIARTLALNGQTRENTAIFVAFDFEEYGLTGARLFIQNYMVPQIFDKYGISLHNFQGAIILDTIMNYDNVNGSQTIPFGMDTVFPDAVAEVAARGTRGDFITVVGRHQDDKHLIDLTTKHWDQYGTSDGYYTGVLRTPVEGRPINWDLVALIGLGDLLRSDHQEFWNYGQRNMTNGLPAVWFTDTANFRGYMRACYHTMCDDIDHALIPSRMNFLLKITNVLHNMINDAAIVQQKTSGAVHLQDSGLLMTLVTAALLFFKF